MEKILTKWHLALLAVLLGLFTASALAASSVLVWPIYQVIESDEKGSALWLENRGSSAVTLQIRVLAWQQQDSKDRYANQTDAIASPPFATVQPNQRQMIRLMKTIAVAPQTERTYRIVIDEIPTLNTAGKTQSGLKLQMRYLLPLFMTGDGVKLKQPKNKHPDDSMLTHPLLSWRLIHKGEHTELAIKNSGIVHARLSNTFFGDKPRVTKSSISLAQGFFTYVLPGQEVRWPLPANKRPAMNSHLYAQLADNHQPTLISPAP
ncbi:molecular chaperone [Lonsdalea quercina]|uniref:fimbrial biogenesis chaperone n=1 Tax=Lonsdalea quercina TaxID=71657 RepID=UPI003974BFEF